MTAFAIQETLRNNKNPYNTNHANKYLFNFFLPCHANDTSYGDKMIIYQNKCRIEDDPDLAKQNGWTWMDQALLSLFGTPENAEPLQI